MTRLRVAVAMSGGLDSSVAALLLQQQGHSVRGVTPALWDETPADPVGAAAAACAHLGIAHEVLDLRAEFRRRVVDYFVASYARGLTPTPACAAIVTSNSACCWSTCWARRRPPGHRPLCAY
jgi:tRNA-specific 2-thiouridylase